MSICNVVKVVTVNTHYRFIGVPVDKGRDGSAVSWGNRLSFGQALSFHCQWLWTATGEGGERLVVTMLLNKHLEGAVLGMKLDR